MGGKEWRQRGSEGGGVHGALLSHQTLVTD